MTHSVEATGTRRPQFDTLAERLWWARETAPLTQAALAMRLGISKRTVQNYESGAQSPSEDRARLWANACDVDFAWLSGDFYARPTTRGTSDNTQVTRADTGAYLAA